MASIHYWDGNDEKDLSASSIQYWDGSALRTFDGTPSLSYWNGSTEYDILPVSVPPSTPQYVGAAAGHASAKVFFSPPSSTGSHPVTSYTVSISPGGTTRTGTTSPITIPNLSNGTAYTFRVRANSEGGSSSYSPASTAVTPRATIPGQQLQYKTVSISLDSISPLSMFEAELDRIAAHGGDVVLVIHAIVDSPTGHTFTRIPYSRVKAAFDAIAERGIGIAMVKPHIVTAAAGDGFYRGDYRPDNIPQFFANWTGEMQHFVGFCNTYGATYLSVSCEQIILTAAQYYDYWVALKNSVKGTQPSIKLTAAFTTAELYDLYTYWIPQGTPHMARLLDAFGINSWIRLTNKVYNPDSPNITVQELVDGWYNSAQGDPHMGRLDYVCGNLGIPYFVTEVGVRPYTGALSTMESGQVPSGDLNYDVQGLLYRSVFAGLASSARCIGVSIWHVHEPFNYFKRSSPHIFAGELAIREAYNA